jgi:hypothetical protein
MHPEDTPYLSDKGNVMTSENRSIEVQLLVNSPTASSHTSQMCSGYFARPSLEVYNFYEGLHNFA